MVTLTDTDNGRTEDIAQNTRFAIQLRENPTTGFGWNATVSTGLQIQSSDYQQDKAAEGMVGVGGTRTWVLVANDLGTQKFSASYRRSWEPVTGNETAFQREYQCRKDLKHRVKFRRSLFLKNHLPERGHDVPEQLHVHRF